MRPEEPYELLAEIGERELALVSALEPGQTAELAEIGRERAALIATLPAQAPAEAQPALARAAYLQERTTDALERLRDEIVRALGGAAQARRAARGYGATIPPRRHRLDRSV